MFHKTTVVVVIVFDDDDDDDVLFKNILNVLKNFE